MVKTIVGIEGMACGMCEAHVNEAVRNAFQVKKVVSLMRRMGCSGCSGSDGGFQCGV